MMLSRKQARDAAYEYLRANLGDAFESGEVIILDDSTIESASCWAFFYESRTYVETGDLGCMLLGNAPLIIDKTNGSLHVAGTAHSAEHYISNYEQYGHPSGLQE